MIAKRLYKHLNSGRLYNVIDDSVKVKVDGVWHPAVIYKNPTETQVYCRLKDNFEEKFKIVDSQRV